MADPFATWEELRDRWPSLQEGEDMDRAELLLGDASAVMRGAARRAGLNLDQMIETDTVDALEAKIVVIAVVRRAMTDRDTDEPDETTVGPFAWKYTRSEPNLWLRDDELAQLGIPVSPGPRAFMGDRGC